MKPFSNIFGASSDLSPPTRGRGLKQFDRLAVMPQAASPPTRGRGLKLEYAL